MKNDCGTSSLFEPQEHCLGPIEKKIKVPVFSLKHFFDLFPWDKFEYIDYIKVDAQGSDLDIIKSAQNYLSDKVVYVSLEAEENQYKNCQHNNYYNMCKYMETQNFIPINHPNTVDPTFINKKFLDLKDNIYINQYG